MANYQKKKQTFPTPFIVFTFIVYMSMLFYVTLFAWNFGSSFGPHGPGGRNYNLEPFLSIYNIAVYSENWVAPFRILGGNVILFIPFGLLFPIVVERIRKWKRATSIILTVILAMMLSVFIEVNQYIFTYRVANVDDVILNTLGGLIGAVSYRILRFVKIV
ncbi:VanZ family protein [Salipaludibacillus keqinensis]|nr:VanZ family protein [Salipaludibacillus keqinensis]